MLTNYPPGITGNEYALCGPDSEEDYDLEDPCPDCDSKEGIKLTHLSSCWVNCASCDSVLFHLEPDYDDDPYY